MRYAVLATDYDGTLATQGHVDAPTLAALEKVRQSGRRSILVTGRHLPDLQSVFSRLDLFDRAVLENGALLYAPETKQERLLCEPPPRNLQETLRKRSVPFSAGRGILATWEPNQTTVLEAIHDLGLDLQVIFNKGAVMVLPSGINKASGLKAALNELYLSFHNVVGIGDAENDHAFLAVCECGVAVANALPSLKERADIVTAGDHGAGVIEIATNSLMTTWLATMHACSDIRFPWEREPTNPEKRCASVRPGTAFWWQVPPPVASQRLCPALRSN